MPPPCPLWNQVLETTQRALRAGALQPIPTACQFVEDGGVHFLVRVVDNLGRKERDRAAAANPSSAPRPNPFLPYDPALYVADASPTHVCLLNKFNVVEHHLLIVTRHFEHQDTCLTRADWEAWWTCLAEYDGLGFYNGGTLAGASQPHKHLQLVPLPLAPVGNAVKDLEFEKDGCKTVAEVARLREANPIGPDSGESGYEGPSRRCPVGPRLPVEPLLADAEIVDGVGRCPQLPFAHRFARLDPALAVPPAQAAQVAQGLYQQMLEDLGLTITPPPDGIVCGAYNLLVTREWMLLVPRRHEYVADVSLNALAFAGALLVRDRDQLEALKRYGLVAALQHAAGLP